MMWIASLLTVVSALLLLGCSLGTKNVLFATKTVLGVNVGVRPPTLDVGFARHEGSIAPTYEGSRVLPLLASFASDAGVVRQALGQKFATGNSALLIAKYIGSPLRPTHPPASIPNDEITDLSRARVAVGQASHVRRYFFGTDTTFGFKVSFATELGGYPESVNLGYKRKELAWVPIHYETRGTEKVAGIPSLLGTTTLHTETANFVSTNLIYQQFYATGQAASYLAAQPAIRDTIGIDIIGDPDAEALLLVRGAEFADVERQRRVGRMLDAVDHLSDERAIQLNRVPPTTSEAVEGLVRARGGENAQDAAVAREMVKMRIVMGQRDEVALDAWEAALRASPGN